MAIRHYHLDYGAIRVNNFPENEIQIAIPIHFLGDEVTVAIDSTGVKKSVGKFVVPSEMTKHIKSAKLYLDVATPSATDATLRVGIYDADDASYVAYKDYAGVGGYNSVSITGDTMKELVGHSILGRVEVTSASATSGATQVVRSITLILILGIS